MSEEKQNCSIISPCDDNSVCNLEINKCENKVNKLTFYIKNKKYAGDTETVVKKIQQAFAHIITRPKCDWGMHMVSLQDYTGKDYVKFQQSLKRGKLLAFYNPETDKILCQSRYDLVNYWKEKRNTFRGIILNEREINFLKEKPIRSAYYKDNKKHEYFLPLSPLLPTIYIKQSQYYNIMGKGQSFFAIVPTTYKWIDTIAPDISAYHNYNPDRGEYGDTLYLIVPLVDLRKKHSDNHNNQSETKEKLKIQEEYCKAVPTYISTQGRTLKMVQQLINQLSSINKNRFAKNLLLKLKAVQSLNKIKPYPYWYDMNGPIGKIVKEKLKTKVLSNIKFFYNTYPVKPVYINKETEQLLVCQKQDLDYETRLYVLIIDDKAKVYPGYFSQNLQTIVEYASKLSGKFSTCNVRLNKYFMEGITQLPSLSVNEYKNIAQNIRDGKEIVKDSPIYGVVELYRNNETAMVICGTSMNAMQKYFNTIIENKYSIGKLLIQLKMDTPFNGDYLSQIILKKELFEIDDEEDEEEDEKKESKVSDAEIANMTLPRYISYLSQQLDIYGHELTVRERLQNNADFMGWVTTIRNQFDSREYNTKEEAHNSFIESKNELDRLIIEYVERFSNH